MENVKTRKPETSFRSSIFVSNKAIPKLKLEYGTQRTSNIEELNSIVDSLSRAIVSHTKLNEVNNLAEDVECLSNLLQGAKNALLESIQNQVKEDIFLID